MIKLFKLNHVCPLSHQVLRTCYNCPFDERASRPQTRMCRDFKPFDVLCVHIWQPVVDSDDIQRVVFTVNDTFSYRVSSGRFPSPSPTPRCFSIPTRGLIAIIKIYHYLSYCNHPTWQAPIMFYYCILKMDCLFYTSFSRSGYCVMSIVQNMSRF